MRIYTRTGDEGKTSIIGGRVDKDDVRVDAYGTVDEVNGFVGQAIVELSEIGKDSLNDLIDDLEKIQHELFDCGGDLANVSPKRELKLKEESITYLENRIDTFIEEAPALEKFILPGGSKPSATIHIARTITRRAERHVVTLMKQAENVPTVPMKYLNRLSDYFFALARVINFRLKVKDIEYARSAKVFRGGKRKGE
ncbi:cob(I)yrinic acid a,c-diamide adenosyltransferase [Bacillus sp. RAR_GA_16]|uniref:cob(I)yrinic acid a,c-diamide adenosyltransferase n=1 Tax=Bacillus sp. RAR_GA_16 TaxID=2876774 RepID=UPI001CCBB979|nr:cob(I)yrinic acid a,c-diamide adenosyltransferase [Bacillus sp. RAR_GA_16]MCA0170397.1 cob(I)yrinic acid a,c-diamide adenosyltransferase [Bacillus sp. RAR_GA_16]